MSGEMSPLLVNVEEHYHRFWGPHRSSRVDLSPEYPVDLLIFRPTDDRPILTIATRGLSVWLQNASAGLEEYARQELIIYLPGSWEVNLDNPKLPSTWACMFLWCAARYMVDKRVFLHLGSFSYTENSRNSTFFLYPCAVLIPPLIEPPEFYPLKVGGTTVQFLAYLFITEAEADFAKGNGAKALLQEMERQDTLELVMRPQRRCTFESAAEKQERKVRVAVVDMLLRSEQVRDHYNKHFGSAAKELDFELEDKESPAGTRLLTLHVFPPTQERPFYTIATTGISAGEMDEDVAFKDYRHMELIAYVSPEWKPDFDTPTGARHWVCNVLYSLGTLPLKGERGMGPAWYQPNGTPPEPLTPGGVTSGLLLTWPLFESKEFNELDVEGTPVRFCQVLPVTVREAEMAKKSIVALLRKMDEVGTLEQFADVARPCTAGLVDGSRTRKPGFCLRAPRLSPRADTALESTAVSNVPQPTIPAPSAYTPPVVGPERPTTGAWSTDPPAPSANSPSGSLVVAPPKATNVVTVSGSKSRDNGFIVRTESRSKFPGGCLVSLVVWVTAVSSVGAAWSGVGAAKYMAAVFALSIAVAGFIGTSAVVCQDSSDAKWHR